MDEKKQKEFEDFFNDLKRDSKTNYIFCPDINCDGFYKKNLQCISSGTYFPSCPKKDEGFRILHCVFGHPNKLPLDYGNFRRVDCSYENCFSSSFNLMSGKYVRIPIERYKEFLKKEFVETNIK